MRSPNCVSYIVLPTQLPGWMAYDMRTMLESYVERGFASREANVKRVAKLIGHKPFTYEAFVKEAAVAWLKASSANTGVQES